VLESLSFDLAGIKAFASANLLVNGQNCPISAAQANDGDELLAPALRLSAEGIDLRNQITLNVSGAQPTDHDPASAILTILQNARIGHGLKDATWAITQRSANPVSLANELAALNLPASVLNAILETL